jgi:hypothetical protein
MRFLVSLALLALTAMPVFAQYGVGFSASFARQRVLVPQANVYALPALQVAPLLDPTCAIQQAAFSFGLVQQTPLFAPAFAPSYGVVGAGLFSRNLNINIGRQRNFVPRNVAPPRQFQRQRR